jgi:hypothetical protein
MNKFIRASKCVVGDIYYLSGMWYEYNIVSIPMPPFITSFNNKPLINTPVKFVGKVKKKSPGFSGMHRFEFQDGSFQTYQRQI